MSSSSEYITLGVNIYTDEDGYPEIENVQVVNRHNALEFIKTAITQLGEYQLEELIKLPAIQEVISRENKIQISAANTIKEKLKLFPRFVIIDDRISFSRRCEPVRLDLENFGHGLSYNLGLKNTLLYQEVDLESIKDIAPELYEIVKDNMAKQKKIDKTNEKRRETQKLNRKKTLEEKAAKLLEEAKKLEETNTNN